jgi:hypothetical protein
MILLVKIVEYILKLYIFHFDVGPKISIALNL